MFVGVPKTKRLIWN